MGFGDAFDGHRDADFPREDGLVVGGGDHAAVGVNKCYCLGEIGLA